MCVQLSSPAHLILDTFAAISDSAPARYQPIQSVRLIDTNASEDGRATAWTGAVAANQTLDVNILALPSIPAGVESVVVRITANSPSAVGEMAVFPCGAPISTTSLAYTTDTTNTNLAISGLTDGRLCVRATTRARVVVDLMGLWVR